MKALAVCGCINVTDVGISIVISHCSQLRTLNLEGLPYITGTCALCEDPETTLCFVNLCEDPETTLYFVNLCEDPETTLCFVNLCEDPETTLCFVNLWCMIIFEQVHH